MDPNQQQMATPEEKQKLLDLIGKIQTGISTVKARSVAGEQQQGIVTQQLLQEVFKKLQMAGVNLEDRNSVRQFIDNLKQQNPLLGAQFEVAMGVLLGEQDPLSAEIPGDPSMSQGGQPIHETLLKG